MNIVYIWIEEYNNIFDKGVNFLPELSCNYSSVSNKICISRKEAKCSSNFFSSNITNVTSIVGENGSGKSSIINFIKDVLGGNKEELNGYRSILVFKHDESDLINIIAINFNKDNNIEILSNIGYKFNFFEDLNFKIPSMIKRESYRGNYSYTLQQREASILEKIEEFRSTQIIYYSNVYDYKSEFDTSFVRNISTNRFIYENVNLLSMRTNEIKMQLDLLLNGRWIMELPIVTPGLIKIAIKDRGSKLLRERLLKLISREDVDKFIEKLKKCKKSASTCIFLNFINDFTLNTYKFNEDLTIQCISYFINNFNKSDRLIEVIELTCKELLTNFLDVPESLFIDLKELLNLADHLDRKILALKNETKNRNKYLLYINYFDESDLIIEFLNIYGKVFIDDNYIEFDWKDMSSGEKAVLSLYSRFYSLLSIKDNPFYKDKVFGKFRLEYPIKNLIILIDEGDAYFHPEWQKEYFLLLIELISRIFSHLKVQLIITSHSPFVLSDIPKENVIFLKREDQYMEISDLQEHKETFAGNIHTLLTDAFFLKDGTIGKFASKKLDDELKKLFSNDELSHEDYFRLKKFISIIGEKVLRFRLEELLSEKMEGNGEDEKSTKGKK